MILYALATNSLPWAPRVSARTTFCILFFSTLHKLTCCFIYFNKRKFEAAIKITPIAPKNVGKTLSSVKFPNKKIADATTNIIPMKNINLLLFGVFPQIGFSVFLLIKIRIITIKAKKIIAIIIYGILFIFFTCPSKCLLGFCRVSMPRFPPRGIIVVN